MGKIVLEECFILTCRLIHLRYLSTSISSLAALRAMAAVAPSPVMLLVILEFLLYTLGARPLFGVMTTLNLFTFTRSSASFPSRSSLFCPGSSNHAWNLCLLKSLFHFLNTRFTSPSYCNSRRIRLTTSFFRKGHIHIGPGTAAAATSSSLKSFHSSSETLYLFSRGSYSKPDAREAVLVGIQILFPPGCGGSAKEIRRDSGSAEVDRSECVSMSASGGCRCRAGEMGPLVLLDERLDDDVGGGGGARGLDVC